MSTLKKGQYADSLKRYWETHRKSDPKLLEGLSPHERRLARNRISAKRARAERPHLKKAANQKCRMDHPEPQRKANLRHKAKKRGAREFFALTNAAAALAKCAP